jgi:hypothetical protein
VTHRRWAVISCNLPLFAAISLTSALLEALAAVTWRLYVWADWARDRFLVRTRHLTQSVPRWWERS